MAADALSRIPDFTPGMKDIRVRQVISSRDKPENDPIIQEMMNHVTDEYKQITEAILNGTDFKQLKSNHPGKPYTQNAHLISPLTDSPNTLLVINQQRLIVPEGYRKRLIQVYHTSHSGVDKMVKSLSKRFHWPGMRDQVAWHTETCVACGEEADTGKKIAFIEDQPDLSSMRPMENISADWMFDEGENWHVVRDRASGYVWSAQYDAQTTANTIDHLESIFTQFGVHFS